jgi:hypothetical protein
MYSHTPTYVRIAFRGTLRKSNFTQVRIALNAYASLASMRAEFDWSKNEPISKEIIIKHTLLSNLIRIISIYFLRAV